MRFRRNPNPFLLLLLPSLVFTAAIDSSDTSVSKQAAPRDAPEPGSLNDRLSNTPIGPIKDPKDVGTKDAPVDGKDGKPHAGPFVDSSSDKEKIKDVLGTDVKKPQGKKPSPAPAKEEIIREGDDGVMNDKNRPVPKYGTTGTEGGVTEKDKDRKVQEGQTGEKAEKKPDPPKEAPPLPHAEEKKMKEQESSKDMKKEKEKEKGKEDKSIETDTAKPIAGLEKPKDLPEKPHDIPIPEPLGSQKGSSGSVTGGVGKTSSSLADPEISDGLIQPLHSYLLSLTMILFSEIGDKTFLIAALMAMKHPRMLVFSAAFSALITMTVLSAVLGHAVPTLIPKRFTNFAAAALFLVFGAKLLREGLGMGKDEGVGEEMKEVEMELEEKEHLARKQSRRRSSITPYMLESGRAGTRKARSHSRLPSPPRSPSTSPERSPSPNRRTSFSSALAGLKNLSSLLLSPAWVQTFIMTFLGEWGDRSQIATIAMAAGQDYWWVTGGAVSGHAVCTAAAVVGGRAIAGRVSLRVVTLGGAVAFLAFGFIYLAEAMYFG